ncbi:orf 28 [Ateline gammaherpesvirus 3]|uniref:Orf 28 n=1 Tax=Ateline herpesvirus 3 TaxID=85618 RepID=Q9YTN8_ATHV3|nr:orf 28 [Ateline gammaherpesvirus 3]AAC95552.1 orf 28 [Ateline gammaherpesvirus 3]
MLQMAPTVAPHSSVWTPSGKTSVLGFLFLICICLIIFGIYKVVKICVIPAVMAATPAGRAIGTYKLLQEGKNLL